jgi:hypothetical protein
MSDKVKSVLHEVTLTIHGSRFMSGNKVPIMLTIVVKELNYGPVLDIMIHSDVPFTGSMDWDDHPLSRVGKEQLVGGKKMDEIIDDTPAIRAVIAELVNPEKQNLYTTTDCTHRAQLIAFLASVWS